MAAQDANADGPARRIEISERVADALHRLRELGPLEEILSRCPAELAGSAGFDRVLLSRVADKLLVPVAAHFSEDPEGAAEAVSALHAEPLKLEYPVLEAEMVRLRRATVVLAPREHPRVRRPPPPPLDGLSYAAAPVVLDGRPVGFLHADRSDRPLDALECDALWDFAEGFALVFERAVLRRRVREQRRRLRHLVAWTDALAGELSDSAIELDSDIDPEGDAAGVIPIARRASGDDSARLEDLLTRRELHVLRLVARGLSNQAIAAELVVSEGTVKFHVKNVLRKLQAANRVEATTRYLELSSPVSADRS